MKILRVQIKCPDKIPNQHLILRLRGSHLARCPLGKHSFIYLVIYLVTSIYWASTMCEALSVLWKHNGDMTSALLELSLIGDRKIQQKTMTQMLWEDKNFKLWQHVREIPIFMLEGMSDWNFVLNSLPLPASMLLSWHHHKWPLALGLPMRLALASGM